ncbi:MAG: YncE family protein [Chloroflexota bacterium]
MPRALISRAVALALSLAALVGGWTADASVSATRELGIPVLQDQSPASRTQHYEYVVGNQQLFIYDLDNALTLVQSFALPPAAHSNIKGVVASPATRMLYISYGGDGGTDGNGSLLKYDLLRNEIVWSKTYGHGVDSMAITPDGAFIYMPVGEEAKTSHEWKVLDAASSDEVGSVSGGLAPHNTVVSLSGAHVYLGGREDRTLYVRNVADGSLYKSIGPFIDTLRPFAINTAESLVYTTHTGLLGFQVASITNGNVLYTAKVEGFHSASDFTTPSHGISLSPDEREIYLIDTANAYAHVFDVSHVPDSAPVLVASIPVSNKFTGNEDGCGTGWCGKIGWLRHTLDGRFVVVGNSGDVIDTAARRVVGSLPQLAETRKMIEIDWTDGVPVQATPREGLGYGPPR